MSIPAWTRAARPNKRRVRRRHRPKVDHNDNSMQCIAMVGHNANWLVGHIMTTGCKNGHNDNLMQTTERITLVPFTATNIETSGQNCSMPNWHMCFLLVFIHGWFSLVLGCPPENIVINWRQLVIRPVWLQLGCANQANGFDIQAASHRLQRAQKQGDHILPIYLTFVAQIVSHISESCPIRSSSSCLCCWLLYFSCCRWRPSWKLCPEKNLHSSFGQGGSRLFLFWTIVLVFWTCQIRGRWTW